MIRTGIAFAAGGTALRTVCMARHQRVRLEGGTRRSIPAAGCETRAHSSDHASRIDRQRPRGGVDASLRQGCRCRGVVRVRVIYEARREMDDVGRYNSLRWLARRIRRPNVTRSDPLDLLGDFPLTFACRARGSLRRSYRLTICGPTNRPPLAPIHSWFVRSAGRPSADSKRSCIAAEPVAALTSATIETVTQAVPLGHGIGVCQTRRGSQCAFDPNQRAPRAGDCCDDLSWGRSSTCLPLLTRF